MTVRRCEMNKAAKVKNTNPMYVQKPFFEVADILREYIGAYQETFTL
jgi:hypothetical protein